MDAPAAPPRTGAATRAALIDAAQVLFTRSGYDHVGVRELAARAGVNAALVNRYFGSKLGLLEQAVDGRFDVGVLLVGDRATLGDRLARSLVRRRRAGSFDPTRLMLRSAASPEAGPLLRAAVAAQVTAPLAAWLGGADAHERAALIASVLFGIGLSSEVLAPEPPAPTSGEALARHLGPLLQRLIDGA
jgi:AcrR family transcriptional regulator